MIFSRGYFLAIFVTLLLVTSASVSARGVYQTNEDFLLEVFDQHIPPSAVVWMKGDVREKTRQILGHPYESLRVRYWKQQNRSAWILEEIGKEKPITFGIVVTENKIEQINVLAFRESRGYEIRYPAFSQQFVGATLNEDKLSHNIDGISGATLSVWAMTSIARLALYLDSVTSK